MIEPEQITALLEKIAQRYGYDFTGYARASLTRRIDGFLAAGKHLSFAETENRLMADRVYFMRFAEAITVNVTEMYRDPSFYRALREKIIPVLATYPFIRVWHAGCSTGEEVYSVAIMLAEANLLHKSVLYATDINQSILEKAKAGVYSLSSMQQYSANYIKSGGTKDFSDYYTANYENAKFDPALSKRMIYSNHNLAADASFNSFQLILCRNTLIYFNRELQGRVLQLFDKSLDSLGFLGLGSKESLRFSVIAPHYKMADAKEKIWRKNK